MASYSKVPDSEAPAPASTAGNYPDANPTELKLLTFIDDAMVNAKPKIPLPQIAAADVGPPPTVAEIVDQLKPPAIAFAISVTTAVTVVFMSNPTVAAIYPYVACVITFAGAFPTMKAQADKLSGAVFKRMETVEDEVNSAVTDLSNTFNGVVSQGKSNVDAVLKEYKPKIAMAEKMESMLKKIDPDIEIPDVSSLEGPLDACADSITNAFNELKAALNITDMLPAPLQSEDKFEQLAFYPVMAFLLVMQLMAVHSAQAADDADDDTSAAAAADDAATSSATWAPVVSAFQVFIASAVQLAITFFLAQAFMIAKLINGMINTVGGNVNGLLDKKLGAVCKEIFGVILGGIKNEMVKLMKKMAKLEGPLKKLPKVPGF